MKRFFYYSLLALLPLGLSAQTQEPELSKTIQVYSEYKPQISDAVRISVNPKVYDTLDLQVNLKYNIAPTALKTDYHLIPLKALSVKGDKLQELYRGEATLGLGNYWTGLLSVRYMTERSRLKQSGVELYHLGSLGKVKLADDSKVPAHYTTDYVNLYWKRFYDNYTLYASATPNYSNVLRYGRETDVALGGKDTTFENKDIRRNLFGITLNGGIVSTDNDENALRYNTDARYDFSYANPKNIENLMSISGGMSQKLERISLGFDADFDVSMVNFEPQYDSSLTKKMQGVFRVLPYAKVGASMWNLRVGINATPVFGSENMFKIFPDLVFSYNIPKLHMVPYAKFFGNVAMHSMKEMLAENPYVADSVMLRPTINKLCFNIGVDGRLRKLVTYNFDFSVAAFEDMYFWKSVSQFPTTFAAVYDDGSLMKLHGDLGFLLRKANVGVNADYYLWQLTNETNPWHKPIFETTVYSRFTILNPNNNKAKLTVEPQAYFMLYQGEAVNDTANISIFDLGFEANYYYSSVLRIFANVNNILGLDNDRYLNYPTQRVNFLIGLSYSFGGHKE